MMFTKRDLCGGSRIKAVFFDVDGTLFSHTQKKVPESARISLGKLSEKGIQCVLATGRHMLELPLLPGCGITRWNDYGVDIIAASGGKKAGIEEYLRKSHIRREETMAFGDGENDLEMLQYVQVGVAMGNADDCVKEIADYVTASVDHDGISEALTALKDCF